jgi:protein TonB
LLLHGLALAGLFVLVRFEEELAPMVWEVSMVMPVVKADSSTSPRTLAKLEPARQPGSKPDAPQLSPEPAARTIAQPAPVIPQPAPPSLASVTSPVTAHQAAAAAPVAEVAVPLPPQPVEATSSRATVLPTPAPDKDIRKRWYAGLRDKLAELKQYPLVARRLGQEGVVVLEAMVQPDGRVEVILKLGSGYAALDRAAVKLFVDAASAMRTALVPDQPIHLEIPVAYRLEE